MMPRFVVAVAFIAAVASSGIAHALEQRPWYGNAFEFEFRPSLTYSRYSKVDTASGTVDSASDDVFATAALGAVVFQRWHLEGEVRFAHTAASDLAVAHLAAAVRYLWLDDVIGDCASLTTGVTVLVPYGRPDLSLQYHGNAGVEGHVAVGSEVACGPSWSWRWWALGAVGIADEGDPWVRGRVALEKNFCDCSQFEVFAVALAGLGDDDLDLTVPFVGYNALAHHSADVGIAYTWCWDCGGDVSASYHYRVYAQNAPEGVHAATLSLSIPFGL